MFFSLIPSTGQPPHKDRGLAIADNSQHPARLQRVDQCISQLASDLARLYLFASAPKHYLETRQALMASASLQAKRFQTCDPAPAAQYIDRACKVCSSPWCLLQGRNRVGAMLLYCSMAIATDGTTCGDLSHLHAILVCIAIDDVALSMPQRTAHVSDSNGLETEGNCLCSLGRAHYARTRRCDSFYLTPGALQAQLAIVVLLNARGDLPGLSNSPCIE
jgi:hypothetical protein